MLSKVSEEVFLRYFKNMLSASGAPS